MERGIKGARLIKTKKGSLRGVHPLFNKLFPLPPDKGKGIKGEG